MRGTKHSRNIYPLSIEESGIALGKKPYADGIGRSRF